MHPSKKFMHFSLAIEGIRRFKDRAMNPALICEKYCAVSCAVFTQYSLLL
ncbi:hypothetical protein RLOC_00007110 [Lonchura striata]|uniref:Uncharacterized protein n=1 Tax=Lonchura striata TaxID=40157 RepID=A0A218UCS8_9PASE|nr:hypothetical protein RLOC_00007110 [Lonchura striata domestica]